jgi:hypothetical protein
MGSPAFARFFALVLALVLAWTAAAAQEPARAPAVWAGELMAAQGTPPSVAELVASLQAGGLDHPARPADGPAQDGPHDVQTPAETLTDLPALVPGCHEAQAPPLTMARPGPYTLAALHPPYLDGLRRPPRPALGA